MFFDKLNEYSYCRLHGQGACGAFRHIRADNKPLPLRRAHAQTRLGGFAAALPRHLCRGQRAPTFLRRGV